MANICSFKLRAVSQKPQNLVQFYRWVAAQAHFDRENNRVYYSVPYHFLGLGYEGDIQFIHDGFNDSESHLIETILSSYQDDYYHLDVEGTCKWSTAYCFIYPKLNSNEDNTLINILQASQLLDMNVEIFSTEPGMQFAEHFIIHRGNITLQETVSYQEFFPDSYASKEMFEKTTNIHITPEQWEQDIITIGGFDSTEFTI